MNLKELLHKRNLTMYEVAKKSNLGQGTVHEIFTGKRKSIRLGTALKLADVLEVDISEIAEMMNIN